MRELLAQHVYTALVGCGVLLFYIGFVIGLFLSACAEIERADNERRYGEYKKYRTEQVAKR